MADHRVKIRESMSEQNLNDLQNLIYISSVRAGWWRIPDIMSLECEWGEWLDLVTPTKISLIHSEISEALEGFRKNLPDEHLPHRRAAEVELADALIRILDLSGAHNFDIMNAVREKMMYNFDRADHKLDNRLKKHGKKY